MTVPLPRTSRRRPLVVIHCTGALLRTSTTEWALLNWCSKFLRRWTKHDLVHVHVIRLADREGQ
ncbi:MAG: hypothetical protein ACJ8G7_24340, partial [Rhizobacter sp.]